MQEIFALLQQAGPSKACVLITGESGTGKELVARTVHALSPRRQGPFLAINCAALPETLIESELFGHEKGSFTGAGTARRAASRWPSTARCCSTKSAKCRARRRPSCCACWKNSQVRRLGGKSEFELDVRLDGGHQRVPEEAVEGGHFREDLYYRLNVFHHSSAALRERKEDIKSPDCRGSAERIEPQARLQGEEIPPPVLDRYVPPLAGQRARIAQCAGARRDPGGRRGH